MRERGSLGPYRDSYRPHIEVSFLAQELGFTSEKECKKFLLEVDPERTLYTNKTRKLLDTKVGHPFFHALLQEKYGKVDIKGQL